MIMEILREREKELTEKFVKQKQQIKETQKELIEVRQQIREIDEGEIQRELEEELKELSDNELDGPHWKEPGNKRGRITEQELEIPEEEENEEPKRKRRKMEIREILEEISESESEDGILSDEELKRGLTLMGINDGEITQEQINVYRELLNRGEREIDIMEHLTGSRNRPGETSERPLEIRETPRPEEREMRNGIPQLFHKICEREGTERIDNLIKWYEYAQRFQEEIEKMKRKNLMLTEKEIVGKIYDKIREQYPKYTRENIRKKNEVARKIWRIFSKIGGKEKIRKMKRASSWKIEKLSIKQIQEWEQTL